MILIKMRKKRRMEWKRQKRNREKESKMAVAKRQGREKPAKIEQKKVRGPE